MAREVKRRGRVADDMQASADLVHLLYHDTDQSSRERDERERERRTYTRLPQGLHAAPWIMQQTLQQQNAAASVALKQLVQLSIARLMSACRSARDNGGSGATMPVHLYGCLASVVEMSM